MSYLRTTITPCNQYACPLFSNNSKFFCLKPSGSCLHVWDAMTLKLKFSLKDKHFKSNQRLSFLFDDKALGYEDKTGYQVIDLETQKTILQFPKHYAFHVSEPYIVGLDRDTQLSIYDLRKPLEDIIASCRNFKVLSGRFFCLRGSWMVKITAGDVGIIQLVDLETEKVVATFADGKHTDAVYSCDINRPKTLAITSSRDRKIKLWRIADSTLIREMENSTTYGHTAWVWDCCFIHENPNHFVTCSFDTTIRVWTVDEFKTETVLAGHERGVNRIACSKNGYFFASCGDESTTRIWLNPLLSWSPVVHQLFGKDFAHWLKMVLVCVRYKDRRDELPFLPPEVWWIIFGFVRLIDFNRQEVHRGVVLPAFEPDENESSSSPPLPSALVSDKFNFSFFKTIEYSG
eukprot:m.72513 g.72513  ORF g.72513 m.72513 type:complete len:403 (+) comp20262_c0_seq1:129-1337(+)